MDCARTTIDDREVKVFGEPERLVVALAKARAAFEDPGLVERGVAGDAGKKPSTTLSNTAARMAGSTRLTASGAPT